MRAGIPQVLAKTTTHLLQPILMTSGNLTISALVTLAFSLTSRAPLTLVVLHHYSVPTNFMGHSEEHFFKTTINWHASPWAPTLCKK